MSRSNLYFKVLDIYKKLYKTRLQVFQDDTLTLKNSLTRLRNDFRANKNLTDQTKIKELLKTAREVNQLLETSVLQTVRSDKENTYRLRVKPYMVTDNHISK